jgi:hypothetical protein
MPRLGAASALRRVRLGMSYRLLRAAELLSRTAARAADLTAGFALHAIDREDRGALTTAIYDVQPGPGRRALYGWEQAWLERELPKAPARVLLGGAGRGRETRWLIDRGYSVVAFDPSREHVAQHRAGCPEASCAVLDYESLARAWQSGDCADVAAAVLAGAPYDVALLGWTSLTHVLDERAQEALFYALAGLVPRGPILASFLMGGATASGRARRLGAQLGRALGPGEHAHSTDDDRVLCAPHLGFAYAFNRERLEQLAQCAARRLELHLAPGSYPHASFVR